MQLKVTILPGVLCFCSYWFCPFPIFIQNVICPFKELVKSKSHVLPPQSLANWAPTCFIHIAKLPKVSGLYLTFCVFKSHFQRRTLGQFIYFIYCCINLLLKCKLLEDRQSTFEPSIFPSRIIQQEKKCSNHLLSFYVKNLFWLDHENIKFIISRSRGLNKSNF